VLGLTALLVVAQVIGVVLTGSLALIADTMDKGVDLLALVFALFIEALVLRPPSAKRTWGLRRLEVLAGCLRAASLP